MALTPEQAHFWRGYHTILPTRPDPPLLSLGFAQHCVTIVHLKNINDFASTVHDRWGNSDSLFSPPTPITRRAGGNALEKTTEGSKDDNGPECCEGWESASKADHYRMLCHDDDDNNNADGSNMTE